MLPGPRWYFPLIFLALCAPMGCNRDERQSLSASSAEAGESSAIVAAQAGESDGFSGVFHASDGSASVLSLTERGEHITGMLDSVALFAAVDGERAIGQIKHPSSGAVLGKVQLELSGGQLALTLTPGVGPDTQTLKMPTVHYNRGPPRQVDVLLDASLVGQWRHARPPVPDSAGSDVWLILASDGSVQQGRSRTSAVAFTGLHNLDDDGFAGRWRTEDRVLHVMPGGSTHWVPLARYHREGDVLQLTYHDGSTQRYERQ